MWASLEFPVVQHKDARDVYILGGLEEIQACVDESNIHVSTILSSRNCGPIRSRVEEWARNLELFSKTVVSVLFCCCNFDVVVFARDMFLIVYVLVRRNLWLDYGKV